MVAPINNSLSLNFMPSVIQVPPTRHETLAPVEPLVQDNEQGYEYYDFSNYNPEIDFGDPVEVSGGNVVHTAEQLGEAMVQALENGFSVQDACNIKMAQVAYKASCAVFKSTFELTI